MCIVRGNIVLLRKRHMQPPSGQKEKLDHPDIRRQRIGMQRLGIGEIGIAAEQAVNDRADETLLKQVLWLRFFQRQRGKDGQLDRAVGGDPTTRSLPTSRMISSAIASGSVNSFGIKEAQARLGQPAALESDAAAGS